MNFIILSTFLSRVFILGYVLSAATAPMIVSGSIAKNTAMPPLAIVQFNSDDPDSFVLLAVRDIPGNERFFITDRDVNDDGNGFSFSNSAFDGTLRWQTPKEGVSAGTLISFIDRNGDEIIDSSVGTCVGVNGNAFSLSSTVDQFFIYQTEDDFNDANMATFLAAIDLDNIIVDPADFDPPVVAGGQVLAVAGDNVHYMGITRGSPVDLLNELSTVGNWLGDDANRFIWVPFEFDLSDSVPPNATLAIASFTSDDPDYFVLVALDDIPGNQVFFITNKRYTASDASFRFGDGTLTWTTPEKSIPAGTLVTFFESSDWMVTDGTVEEDASFSLSSIGDRLIIYQGSLGDATTATFVAALTFNGFGSWESSGSDEPPVVEGGQSIALFESDNGYFLGQGSGTASEVLAALNDPLNWAITNEDAVYFGEPTFTIVSSIYCLSEDMIPFFRHLGQSTNSMGNLAVIETADLNSNLTTLVNDANQPELGAWIGLFSFGGLIWTDFSVSYVPGTSFNAFVDGEPVLSNGRCIQLNSTGWFNSDCADSRNAIYQFTRDIFNTVNTTALGITRCIEEDGTVAFSLET